MIDFFFPLYDWWLIDNAHHRLSLGCLPNTNVNEPKVLCQYMRNPALIILYLYGTCVLNVDQNCEAGVHVASSLITGPRHPGSFIVHHSVIDNWLGIYKIDSLIGSLYVVPVACILYARYYFIGVSHRPALSLVAVGVLKYCDPKICGSQSTFKG